MKPKLDSALPPCGERRKGDSVELRSDTLLAYKILPYRPILVGEVHFFCPYCKKSWERGGHKEGFVKSAAKRHVYACWEIVLFNAGYVALNRGFSDGRPPVLEAVPVLLAEARHVLALRAMIRQRRKQGLNPTYPVEVKGGERRGH